MPANRARKALQPRLRSGPEAAVRLGQLEAEALACMAPLSVRLTVPKVTASLTRYLHRQMYTVTTNQSAPVASPWTSYACRESPVSQPSKRPAEVLASANPAAAEAFAQMRKAVETGPLDQGTVELILIGALASTGQLSSLAVHVKRALSLGVEMAAIQQSVVSTLGASCLFNDVVEALRTIEGLAA